MLIIIVIGYLIKLSIIG